MTGGDEGSLGFTCAAESRRDNGELIALLALVTPLTHPQALGQQWQGNSGRWSSQQSSFENSPFDSTSGTPRTSRSFDQADALRRAFNSSSRPGSRPTSPGQPLSSSQSQSQSQSPQKRTMDMLPPLASPPHSPSAPPPTLKIKGRQWATALSYYTQSVRTRDSMMYGGVEDIRLPAIAGTHMGLMTHPKTSRQGLVPGVLTNPTALLSESLKRLDRHETLHLCDILGFDPSTLNKLNGHPTELVEAMRDDVEMEEEEFEDEQKYQREVMMASLISSWRAFRPEDCEDVPDADDYYDNGFGHHTDNSRQGHNTIDPRLSLLLNGGGGGGGRNDPSRHGVFTARLNAFDDSGKSILSVGAGALTGRTDYSEKERSPHMMSSGHKTGRTASSRLLLTRSSFRVSPQPLNALSVTTTLTRPSIYPFTHSSTHPDNQSRNPPFREV